jgi:2'-5' RNA ligase
MSQKINVHFAFAPDSVTLLRQMNARLRAFTPSLIVFDETSPHIPHVSLQMGTLNTDDDLPLVAKAAEATARRYRQRDLILRRPYLENVRNHYVFCDVANEDRVFDVRDELRQALASLLIVQDDYAEVPHVTLAHISIDHAEIDPFLGEFPDRQAATVVAIEVSDTGPKGTCVNPLYRYSLL